MDKKELDLVEKVLLDLGNSFRRADITVSLHLKPNNILHFEISQGDGIYGNPGVPTLEGNGWQLNLSYRNRGFMDEVDREAVHKRISDIVKEYGSLLIKRLIIHGNRFPLVMDEKKLPLYKSRKDFYDHPLRSDISSSDVRLLSNDLDAKEKITFFRWSSDNRPVLVGVTKTHSIQAYILYDPIKLQYIVNIPNHPIFTKYFNDFTPYNSLDDILNRMVELGYKKTLPVYNP